jgi:hypothetical protein
MMHSRAVAGVTGLLVLALAAPAHAVELSFGSRRARVDVTSTTIGSYHTDNDNDTSCDDNYGEALERLNAQGFMGAWTVGLRLDAAVYFDTPVEDLMADPPCGDLEERFENQVVPEKIWVGWSGRSIEGVAGDSYVSFGRGLTLSLRKVDELGVDTTLRGAKVLVHEGRLGAALVGGFTNIGNVDEASGRTASDPNDIIGGVEGTFRVADGVTLGAHAAYFAFHHKATDVLLLPFLDDSYKERWLIYGPFIDAPRLTPHIGVYLEGVGQRRGPLSFEDPDGAAGPLPPEITVPEIENGYGLYGAATIFAGRATILLEGKAYGDLATVKPQFEDIEFNTVQYTNPPTVERVLQPLENPQRDIAGGRANVTWSFSPTMQAFVNYGFFRDWLGYQGPLSGMNETGDIHDPYAGFDVRWDQARSRAIVSAGYRVVFTDDASGATRGDIHLDLDLVQSLTPRLSLEVHGSHLERHKAVPLGDEDWREGTLQIGLSSVRPRLSVAAVLDYTTDPTQPKDIYPSGTLQWDITDSSSIRLTGGASRGGLKCVSGICRVFPPFEGVKLSGVLRF